MFLLILFLMCLFVAMGAGVMASLSDYRGMVIPNSYSVIVIAAFVAAYALLWLFKHEGIFYGFGSHLLAALLIFGITAGLFALHAIGAADSKLASAFAFWMGLPGLISFVFYTSLVGGILALGAIAIGKWKPFKAPKAGSWLARVQAGESKVPYGIAISAGALASFVKLGYFDIETLRAFLSS